MKLICINNKIIEINNIRYLGRNGGGLEEGTEYETKGEVYNNGDGQQCYYIVGKGSFLAIRFTKALEETQYIYTNIKTEEPSLN
jgi:hypothetical protein